MAFDARTVVSVLREVAGKYPRAYGNAHRGENTHPEAWDFIILGARALSAIDSQYGINGKRGNVNDLSSDIIAYGFGRGCRVFDVIIGAGEHGNDPNRIACNEVTQQSKDASGNILTVWIDPWTRETVVDYSDGGIDPPPPPPPPPPVDPWKPYIGDAHWDVVGEALFADYAEAGQAPNPGMGRWFGRTIWDATNGEAPGKVLEINASIKKHRYGPGGWRRTLGLSS
jgi:hypothetical protein